MNLYENLESTFIQEYANFEIIFSVADPGDQAIGIVQSLMQRYPGVKSRLIVGEWVWSTNRNIKLTSLGERVVGVNPKVNNLVRSYEEATFDILWVIDSNIIMDRGALARAVDALTSTPAPRRIGLVHHVPYAVASEQSLGARIEAAFLNTNHAKMYIAINTFATESCVVGKSNLFRRSDVDIVDGSLKPLSSTRPTNTPCGFPQFSRFLAEDNMIASALWHELDLRHSLSCDVAKNIIGSLSVKDYILRRARWIRVRKHMVLAATVAEPFTESLALALILTLSAGYMFGIPPWACIMGHYIPWLWVDFDVLTSLAGQQLPRPELVPFLTAWALREMLAFPVYCYAIVGNNVQWRGATYKVLRDGEVQEIDQVDSSRPQYQPLRREI